LFQPDAAYSLSIVGAIFLGTPPFLLFNLNLGAADIVKSFFFLEVDLLFTFLEPSISIGFGSPK
jgi:hypothetical protein